MAVDIILTRLPYRRRTWVRTLLPDWLIRLGWANKGSDCEAAGGPHEWYNLDERRSGCYHCRVVARGRLWEIGRSYVYLRPPL